MIERAKYELTVSLISNVSSTLHGPNNASLTSIMEKIKVFHPQYELSGSLTSSERSILHGAMNVS